MIILSLKLVLSWLRYGITGSRQKNYAYDKQVKLDPENQTPVPSDF